MYSYVVLFGSSNQLYLPAAYVSIRQHTYVVRLVKLTILACRKHRESERRERERERERERGERENSVKPAVNIVVI